VDGALSDKTRAAISAFQSKRGLPVTGIPSDDLLRQILLGDSVASAPPTGSVAATDSIAAKAAESATIKRVQEILADLGYAPGPIDGAWGANTASAVSAFQRDRNIAQTGQITPQLLNELRRVTGRDLTRTASHP
jgi:peptidoglycan hydrolase-like protein with peptidoglycan-binding domain